MSTKVLSRTTRGIPIKKEQSIVEQFCFLLLVIFKANRKNTNVQTVIIWLNQESNMDVPPVD